MSAVCAGCAAEIEAGHRFCLPCAKQLAAHRDAANAAVAAPHHEPDPRRLSRDQRRSIKRALVRELAVPIGQIVGDTAAEMRESAEKLAAERRGVSA